MDGKSQSHPKLWAERTMFVPYLVRVLSPLQKWVFTAETW